MASTRKKTANATRTKRPANFRSRLKESDGQYLLKLVVVIILGTFWFKFGHVFYLGSFAVTGVPLGMLLGMVLVDKFEVHQDDRKIWYAILVIVAIVSYFLPMGVVI
jgi:positive regulator of sigma E activity